MLPNSGDSIAQLDVAHAARVHDYNNAAQRGGGECSYFKQNITLAHKNLKDAIPAVLSIGNIEPGSGSNWTRNALMPPPPQRGPSVITPRILNSLGSGLEALLFDLKPPANIGYSEAHTLYNEMRTKMQGLAYASDTPEVISIAVHLKVKELGKAKQLLVGVSTSNTFYSESFYEFQTYWNV